MPKVLLIDDQRVSLDQAQVLLRPDGYDLIEATDALAGLHRAVEDAPDCVVVDLGLNGIDGLSLCRQLRASDAARGVPVIVWGAAPAVGMRALSREAGAFAYVDRAQSPTTLRGTVSRALLERLGRKAAVFSIGCSMRGGMQEA